MRLILLVLFLLLQAGLAAAVECNFGSRSAAEAARISYAEFMARERGAIAITEGRCGAADNICEHYIVISHCDSVLYAHPPGDAKRPLSISFNTVLDSCDGAAVCSDTFLHAAMRLGADPAWQPSVDVVRNRSDRWEDTFGVATSGYYFKTVLGAAAVRSILQRSLDPAASFRSLVDLGLRWHSSFLRNDTGTRVLTWPSRRQVLDEDDPAACQEECSLKLYLIKFEESASLPRAALRFSGNMLTFPTMHLRTWAEASGFVYNSQIDFTFVVE
ncbi:hypothetical protein ACFSX5_06820 [Devosia albogilva]|uniref:Uncharacterized protein n=1 Tax=Devosia albogilva TaxID=429726 RepID=A0ABW5QJG7_9HYPH